MSPAEAGRAAARLSAAANPTLMAASVPLRMQRTLELGLVHLRPAGDVGALGLLVELRPARIALGPRPPGLAAALPLLRPFQGPAILGRALLVGAAGLVQRDGDRLTRVAHLASAGALQLAMLELVHDPADDLFLLWVLLPGHQASLLGAQRAAPLLDAVPNEAN